MIILGIRANEFGSMAMDSAFVPGKVPAIEENKRKRSLPIASLVELPPRKLQKLLRKEGQTDVPTARGLTSELLTLVAVFSGTPVRVIN